jgi:hypothetical protein
MVSPRLMAYLLIKDRAEGLQKKSGGAGMRDGDRLVFEAADAIEVVNSVYVEWEAGNLEGMKARFHEDVAFSVQTQGAASFIGDGHSRGLFFQRLGMFLDEYEVVNYGTQHVSEPADGWVDCRIRYRYRNKVSAMEIDGTMRHVWCVAEGKVVVFMVMHDAKRMGAFFELCRLARLAA